MLKPEPSRIRSAGFFAAIVFIALLFFEGLGWAYFEIKAVRKPSLVDDDYLGWTTQANVYSKREMPPYGVIEYSTGRDGFRRYGDPDSDAPKIMVVGDSYTQARTVNDGETYYDILGTLTGAEIFAIGVGGFGTLQEYLIIDRHVDAISPNVIIWQMTTNDFYNNSWRLAATSRIRNYMVRPFLEDDEIVYRYPSLSWWVRTFVPRSKFLRLVTVRLNLLLSGRRQGVSIDDPLMIDAVATTKRVLERAKRRVGPTPIVAFSTYGTSTTPANRVIKDIVEEAGLRFTEAPLDSVRGAEARGIRVDAKPGNPHWNGTGHRIAGEVLADYLVSSGLFE